jgi:diguanylate cyclase (GGDEF)-like protein
MATTVKRTHVVSRRIAAGLGLLAAALGLLGLAGWIFHVPWLLTALGGNTTIKANTALGLVAAGIALFAFSALPRQSWSGTLLRRGGAALAGLIGLATILQHRLGIDFGVDQLLFTDKFTASDLFPGRMPRVAAGGLALCGLAMAFLPRAPAWAFWTGFTVTAIGFWIALFITVGFAFNVQALYGFAWYWSVSPQTAVAYLALFTGLMFAVPDRGWARIVMTDKVGGYIARRLLPLMAVLPLIVLWLAGKAADLGLYPQGLREYVTTIALLIALTAVVLVACGRLNVLDKHRRTIEGGRQRAHAAALRLREIADTDALTGLSNRRHFLTVAAEKIAPAHTLGTPLSLLMVDIDHFKRINDTHGHAAGDHALRLLAATLKESTRKDDCAGRLGGEEFALVLPGATPAVAQDIAERICKYVATLAILDREGRRFGFTVSIGLATLGPSDAKPEDLLARADAALYRAKRAGRNRVEAAEGTARDAA